MHYTSLFVRWCEFVAALSINVFVCSRWSLLLSFVRFYCFPLFRPAVTAPVSAVPATSPSPLSVCSSGVSPSRRLRLCHRRQRCPPCRSMSVSFSRVFLSLPIVHSARLGFLFACACLFDSCLCVSLPKCLQSASVHCTCGLCLAHNGAAHLSLPPPSRASVASLLYVHGLSLMLRKSVVIVFSLTSFRFVAKARAPAMGSAIAAGRQSLV